MAGQATVAIGDRQWVVYLATTPDELVRGLGGLAAIPPGTGMLFDISVEQAITVTTVPMLFPLDIVFISGGVVTTLALNVPPGQWVTGQGRYFLEVNAGEAAEVQPGMPVMGLVPAQDQGEPLWQTLLAGWLPNLLTMALAFAMVRSAVRTILPSPRLPSRATAGQARLPYVAQTATRQEVIEVPFRDAPQWVQREWMRLHPGSAPRVRVHRTAAASIGQPVFEYAVRDIVAHKAGRTLSRYVPSYDSLVSATPQEKALYFGGAVKLGPDEAIAVMDYWGDRYRAIDLYVHPQAYQPPSLLAPPLTERQKRILATIRAYIPSYRKELFQRHRVAQAELDELQRMGLIDRRGAITVMGRNVIGQTEPFSRYLAQTRPLKPPVDVGDFLDSLGGMLDEGGKAESLKRLGVALGRLTPQQRDRIEGLEDVEAAIREYQSIQRQGMSPEEYQEEKEAAWGEIEEAVDGLSVCEEMAEPPTGPLGGGSHKVSGSAAKKAPVAGIEYYADSAGHCRGCLERTGIRHRLGKAFQQAITRARGIRPTGV